MQTSHRPSSTRADLARVLAGWLMVILLVQSLAAACAFVVGPQHHHRNQLALATAAQGHFHGADEHHYHSPLDVTVMQTDRDLAVDSAAMGLLAIVFAALALVHFRHVLGSQAHVKTAAALWALSTHQPLAARRPPRA